MHDLEEIMDFRKTVINKTEDMIKMKQMFPKDWQVELLYRGTKDGFKAEDFHKICDNKGSTLSLAKTVKGNIFGGYTPIPWTIRGGNKKGDSESFLVKFD